MMSYFILDIDINYTVNHFNQLKPIVVVHEGKPNPFYSVAQSIIDTYQFHIDDIKEKMLGETFLPDDVNTVEDVHNWIMSLSEHG